MRLLVTAYDTGPWWQRDQWNPVEDTRIPLRDHEPTGRYSVRFDRIDTGGCGAACSGTARSAWTPGC